MKRIVTLLCLVLAAAFAQNGEKVRRELERVDRFIADAAPVIERSENQKAIELLASARRIQDDAWNMYRQQRYRAALGKTNWAFQLADKALSLARFSPERVAEELRRTAELANEAGPKIVASGNPRAIELWKVAQAEQDAARNYFAQEQYLLALKFTFAARLHIRAALEIIHRGGDSERVRLELERTDRLMERAKERVRLTAEHRVRELFARASAWQEQAREAFRQERSPVALRLTFAARDIMLRAWEIGLGTLNQDLVEAALAETDLLVSQWSAAITERGGAKARLTFEQAIRQQQQARQSFNANDLKRAWQETTAARRMITRAIEQLQSGPEQQE